MSLRLRLLLAAGVVALVALVVADLTTYAALGSYLNDQVDGSLNLAHAGLEACLDAGTAPSSALVEGNDPGAFLEEVTPSGGVVGRVSAFRFQQGGGGGSELIGPALPAKIAGLHPHRSAANSAGGADCETPGSEDTVPSSPPATTRSIPGAVHADPVAAEQVVYFSTGPAENGGPAYRVRASTLTNGNIMILATPLTATSGTLDRLLWVEIGVTGVALLVAVMLGWWLVRLGLRPLVEIEQTAESISEADLTSRIPEPRRKRTEIGRLAVVLNSMLSRIEGAFAARRQTEKQLSESEERMRQFLADASHELRTPLAAVFAYSELFDRSSAEHPEDLPRIMNRIRIESSRMGQLVGDLLLLAKLDDGRPLEAHPVELVSLVSRAVEAAQAVGPDWPVRLLADAPVEVVGDPARIRQVVDNLLANVRAHTPPQTACDVTVASVGSEAEILVADHGPGLSASEAEHVFDRFHRADASRTRASGGSGLGLSIVRAIVQAHGGSVAVATTPGGGATFRVHLPLHQPAEHLESSLKLQ